MLESLFGSIIAAVVVLLIAALIGIVVGYNAGFVKGLAMFDDKQLKTPEPWQKGYKYGGIK